MNNISKTYNTLEAILKSISSLALFNDLIKLRHDAGYLRKESLTEFIVLGAFYLDTCGNCMQIIGKPVKTVESVMFMDVCRSTGLLNDTSFSMSNNIPPANVFCPICGKPWDIGTILNCRCENTDFSLDGNNVLGKTIKQVKEYLNGLTDGKYFIRKENCIRNDRFIDLRKHKDYPSLSINERGWVDAKEDYIIMPGDEIDVNKWTYYHIPCLSKREENKAQEIINKKGVGYNHLYNMAGNDNCDHYIKAELTIAGIRIVEEDHKGEVPYHYTGLLGINNEFKFWRAWRYWVVLGSVPLDIAEELYANEVGSKYVRVAGHCGCPPPKEWAEEDPNGKFVVTTYHIDTLPGLMLFSEKISKVFGR